MIKKYFVFVFTFLLFASLTSAIGPAPPSNPQATVLGSSGVALSWTDNANDENNFYIGVFYLNGSFITSWYAPANSGTGGTVNLNVYQLSPQTSYEFRISAVNNDAFSSYANVFATTTAQTQSPAAPTNLQGSALGGTSVALNWTDNSNNEDYYDIRAYNASGDQVHYWSIQSISGTGPAIVYLSYVYPQTAYTFKVSSCSNINGCSAYSNTISLTTPAIQVPTAPTNLQGQASGAASAHLTWTDNSNNEIYFEIDIYDSLNHFITSWSAPANSGVGTAVGDVLSLSPQTTYKFNVSACNSDGCSAYTNTITITTPVAVLPTAPSNLQGSVLSSTLVNLNWTDNSNNENYFEIRVFNSSGSQVTTWTANSEPGVGNKVFVSIGYLSPQTIYNFKISACNNDGCSANSNTLTLTTPAALIPAAPSNLQGRALGATAVSLNWTDNSNNEQYFEIKIFDLSNNLVGTYNIVNDLGVGSKALADLYYMPVNPQTTYKFNVSACNWDGCSSSIQINLATAAASLIFNVYGLGNVSFSDGKLCSANNCVFTYASAPARLTLTQIAYPRSTFMKWEGCDSVDGQNRCIIESFTGDKSTTISAYFTLKQGLQITTCKEAFIGLPGKYNVSNNLLVNSLSNTSDNNFGCINVVTDNIEIDGKGNNISLNTSYAAGIFATNYSFDYTNNTLAYTISNITIKNLTFYSYLGDVDTALELDNLDKSNINNIKIYGSYPFSLMAKNSRFENITISNFTDDGMYIYGSRNNIFANINMTSKWDEYNDGLIISEYLSTYIDGNVVNAYDSGNNTFRDITLKHTNVSLQNYTTFYCITANSSTFVNVTYNSAGEYLENCILTRKWYFSGNVTDPSSVPISGANIIGKKADQAVQFNINSNVDGSIPLQEVTEYVNTNRTITNYNPYSITTSKSGYSSNVSSVNFNKNIALGVKLSSSSTAHPVDQNSNFTVEAQELLTYKAYFKTATPWVDGSGLIPSNYATNSIVLFKFGPKYTYNSSITCPSCWVPF